MYAKGLGKHRAEESGIQTLFYQITFSLCVIVSCSTTSEIVNRKQFLAYHLIP